MTFSRISNSLLSGLAVLALSLGGAGFFMPTAQAQSWQGPQGGPNQGNGTGAGAEAGGGHGGGSSGGHSDSTHQSGDEHEGSGREGGSSHQPAGGTQGGQDNRGGGEDGRPVWAGEGIPEVELGRINVVRSPRTLDRALAEAREQFDPATMTRLYQARAIDFANAARVNWDTISIIDSPVQNLALLRELWRTKTTSLPGVNLGATNIIELSSILLGVASDKEIPITTDTVRAVSTIFGVSMSDSMLGAIASRAEVVRQGVLAGHG